MLHLYYRSIQTCFQHVFQYFNWCRTSKPHEKPILPTIHSEKPISPIIHIEKQIPPTIHTIKIDDYIKTEHNLCIPVNRSYNFEDEYEIV